MTEAIQVAMLADGRRLHLQHGPIDLVIEAFGTVEEVRAAYDQAIAVFDGVLVALVGELDTLKQEVRDRRPDVAGPVARRMVDAVWPHRTDFITPMAAVAGAVADHVLDGMIRGRMLERAYVNNGGDIALFLGDGACFDAGLVARAQAPALDGVARIGAALPVRGIATSGKGGRSLSLGIADSVTVLARNAAVADAAATLIANAVNVDHPAIIRRLASEMDESSDLGDRLVTVSVGPLDATAVRTALAAGIRTTETLRKRGVIHSAVLMLDGQVRIVTANEKSLIHHAA